MNRVCCKFLVCCFLLPVSLDPGLDLHAQKQPTTPKVQRSRKPVAPAPVAKPTVKAPELPPVATALQAPLASLQSQVTEARLQNGLKVLLQESHSTPLVSVGCWYRVGSKDDPAGAAGFSNLARMLRLREMESYSRDQTGRLMRETGGDWHSTTLPDQTGFFETVPVGALEEVLKLEAARMSGSVVADLQFRGQRRRAAAAVHAREDSLRSLLDDEVTAAALQRHPYRWPSLGWLPDVELIGREDVARHSRLHFVPNNAVLVLVGDFETRMALGLVEKHFGVIARRPDPRRAEVREPERRGERRVQVASEGTTPYVQFAFQVPELFNDDFYAMLVVDAVLTGAQGMRHWSNSELAVAKGSSRLFQALVETGIALEIRSRMAPRQAPSLYQLTLTLPDAFQFQAAEEAVLEQLERLKSQEVSDVELAKAKNLLVTGEFLAQDSVAKRAFQLGYFESIASHQVLNEIEPKILQVNKEDIRRVAIRYFAGIGRTVGSVVPALKRRTIEVETLSASGAGSLAPAQAAPQPALMAKELDVRTPSLQPILVPESIFDSKVSDGPSLQEKPRSELRAFADIPTAHPRTPKVHRKVLPNGVTLIVAGNQSGSTVTIRASIRTADGGTGVAALVSGLLRRGLSGKSQASLASVFDFLGAEVSSELDDEISTTIVRGLSKDCGTFLQLLAEMLQSHSFGQPEFDKARDESLGRLRELEEEADWGAEQALRQRLYTAGHSSQNTALGTVGSVEHLRLADARDFYQRYYRPQQLIVSIAGDILPEATLTAGENAFGSWKGEASAVPPSATRMMPSQKTAEAFESKTKRSVLVLAGLASPSAVQPDYYPFLILNQILAGAPAGGRLGDRVLAGDAAIYGIQEETIGGTSEPLFSVRVMAEASEVERAITLMREEFGRIKGLGVTEEEIRRAKRSLIHAWTVRMGNHDDLARMLQQLEAHGLSPDYLEKYPTLIEGVSRENLLDCARTRFDFDRAAIVVVTPAAGN
jgi:zinc protease